MRNAVLCIINRELLFVCFCDERFCKKNEGFSKREFFIRYPKLTLSSDELICLFVTYLQFRFTFFNMPSVVSSVSQHFNAIFVVNILKI